MGQVLHGSATTTEAVRRAIQHSQESLRALAKRYGINPKTVARWTVSGLAGVPQRDERVRSDAQCTIQMRGPSVVETWRDLAGPVTPVTH